MSSGSLGGSCHIRIRCVVLWASLWASPGTRTGCDMATLAYTRSGAGTPLVLLHALGLSRRIWDPVIPALSEQFDVLAVDLPGFGDSAPLPRPWRRCRRCWRRSSSRSRLPNATVTGASIGDPAR